jgi:hypothetical protein
MPEGQLKEILTTHPALVRVWLAGFTEFLTEEAKRKLVKP